MGTLRVGLALAVLLAGCGEPQTPADASVADDAIGATWEICDPVLCHTLCEDGSPVCVGDDPVCDGCRAVCTPFGLDDQPFEAVCEGADNRPRAEFDPSIICDVRNCVRPRTR